MADLNMAAVMSLSGRVALVTGGGTGIGFYIAQTFAANGAKVYITGRRLDVLEKAAASVTGIPGSIIPLQMDVADEEAVKASAKHIENIDGKLDILVNNAGFAGSLHDPDFFAKKLAAADPFEPETIQNWADMFASNTIAPFFIVRAFQSLLINGAHSRPQGTSSVINISSVAAQLNSASPGVCVRAPPCRLAPYNEQASMYIVGVRSQMAYSVTKAALDKLTLVLGSSFAGRGIPIRVNSLQPGSFASQMVSSNFLEMIKTKAPPGFVAPIPARRHGSDAEMGMTAVYLAVSDYTNGAVLSLDGGASLVNP